VRGPCRHGSGGGTLSQGASGVMAGRKPFLLRLDPVTHEALQRWADAELRSLNSQIEFLLRRALSEAGRLPSGGDSPATPGRRATPPGKDR
jgi:hypothetical protein